ncbi:uncharacterized protein LMH87_008729 [Akanthomyces muscarius]|uniref:Uncharacterized protein n=1 Tax=Akanthomyces muscarius TaxID=2231603 RepID=A0A9W8QJ91_AKAMU|nr:uncharacterized protein LMH87_008729 [Akanthomyces muscarius]KAJ4158194.1 hypothetical protein LMH87_008729 [Akanthomyces muscarius]
MFQCHIHALDKDHSSTLVVDSFRTRTLSTAYALIDCKADARGQRHVQFQDDATTPWHFLARPASDTADIVTPSSYRKRQVFCC